MGRRPTHDPRGYYRVLGVSTEASEAEIKAAYRRKALELHPDRNRSANAAAEFHFLSTAYKVLSDSRLRTAYHNDTLDAADRRSRRSAARSAGADPAARASRAYARAADRASESPPPGFSGSSSRGEDPFTGSADSTRGRNGAAPPLPPLRVCSSCRNVTAQPRYVIFPRITGRRNRLVRDTVSGVFCSRCADRTALVTALHNWVRGWWAFPSGPPQTLLALWTCLRGGIRPKRENHALLMEQARAFQAREQREIACGLAYDAQRFAPGKTERQTAERLVETLSTGREVRRLRNVWHKRGPGFWLQILVPGVLVLSIVLVASPWLREELPFSRSFEAESARSAGRTEPPRVYVDTLLQTPPRQAAPGGRLHAVLSPFLIVRTGPGRSFGEVARLRQNTFVILVDMADDDWARIVTRDGVMGWVPKTSLLAVDAAGVEGPAEPAVPGLPPAAHAPISPLKTRP